MLPLLSLLSFSLLMIPFWPESSILASTLLSFRNNFYLSDLRRLVQRQQRCSDEAVVCTACETWSCHVCRVPIVVALLLPSQMVVCNTPIQPTRLISTCKLFKRQFGGQYIRLWCHTHNSIECSSLAVATIHILCTWVSQRRHRPETRRQAISIELTN